MSKASSSELEKQKGRIRKWIPLSYPAKKCKLEYLGRIKQHEDWAKETPYVIFPQLDDRFLITERDLLP
jgi:hypothetical protein